MTEPSAMPIDLANVLTAIQRAARDLALAEEPAGFAAALESGGPGGGVPGSSTPASSVSAGGAPVTGAPASGSAPDSPAPRVTRDRRAPGADAR